MISKTAHTKKNIEIGKEYNDAFHQTVMMKPVAVESNTYINFTSSKNLILKRLGEDNLTTPALCFFPKKIIHRDIPFCNFSYYHKLKVIKSFFFNFSCFCFCFFYYFLDIYLLQ